MNIKKVLKFVFPEIQVIKLIQKEQFFSFSKFIDPYEEQDLKNRKKKGTPYLKQEQVQRSSVGQQNTTEYKHFTPSPTVGNTAVQNNVQQQRQQPQNMTSQTVSGNNQSLANKYTDQEIIDIFGGIKPKLTNVVFGQEAYIDSLLVALKRPFLTNKADINNKGTTLVIGPENTGKHFAITEAMHHLGESKLVKYPTPKIIDCSKYAAKEQEDIFLTDMYDALYGETSAIIFDNIEHLHPTFLTVIIELIMKLKYELKQRYHFENGVLSPITGTLQKDAIAVLELIDKYLFIVTTLNESKIEEILGVHCMKEITDIIHSEMISENALREIIEKALSELLVKAREQVDMKVSYESNVVDYFLSFFEQKFGAESLRTAVTEKILEALSEYKLKNNIGIYREVHLYESNNALFATIDGSEIALAEYERKKYVVDIDAIQKELSEVVGLDEVKNFIYGIEQNLKIQQKREADGLKSSKVSMHMVFTGNPGTGKTTIARIVAKYLKAIGVLEVGHLREVTRADLVGQYVGHTAQNTLSVINSALGGVLFIDEAYALCRDENDTFGLEAVDTLVKAMEDNRENLVVILAGYKEEMGKFLDVNTGLKSRFPNHINFPDYTSEQMLQLMHIMTKNKGYFLANDLDERLLTLFDKSQINGRTDGGNGRLIRNLVEAAIIKQSSRISKDSSADLSELVAEDFVLADKTTFNLKEKLDGIIGLDSVKKVLYEQQEILRANDKRKSAGLVVDTTQTLHMIFTGNPGTGKTTIARIVAEMLNEMGVLKSGHLVEVDRTDLIAEYVGQTTKKTEAVFRSALGGVLFIDEAYSLNNGSSFGKEAIDTLVKLMEDYREDIIVILAGYKKEMKDLMDSNTGLASRFPLNIEFPDYNADELKKIAKMMIKNKGFILTDEAEKEMDVVIDKKSKQATVASGNARMVRNYIEEIIRKQSSRIATTEVGNDDLQLITEVDIITEIVKEENFSLEKELEKVIGLDSVKKVLYEQQEILRANDKRKSAGLVVDTTQTLHMIFTGNPGTGKTTIARIVAEMLNEMGVLNSGHLVEVDRTDLIAEYVGQTTKKTEAVFRSALGGVLFIDEAYSLNNGSSFDKEAIDTLVKLMEDYREDIIVILAGYKKEMRDLMNSNTGLASRFPLNIEFPDYNSDELKKIAKMMIKNKGFILTDEAEKEMDVVIDKKSRQATVASGNARMVRNYIEEIIRKQSSRIATTEVENDDLQLITEVDIITEIIKEENFSLEKELEKVIGLEEVKEYIRSLGARLYLDNAKKEFNLKHQGSQTLHMIFKGNPGTGKTMMARLLADMFFNMGVISTNKMIETDRAGLVAGYVGQTAIKTTEKVMEALDGVLFIDEAYSLSQPGIENDFGNEAIDTLVKLMDDHRDRIVVILAGYDEDMDKFIHVNAGLKSRFPNVIDFADYTSSQLLEIGKRMYEDKEYLLPPDALLKLESIFREASVIKNFGNGRYVRNVFEKSLNNQALRLQRQGNFTKEQVITVLAEDIEEV